jgi:hypothetical protein
MMWAPSGVCSSVGDVLRYSGVVMLSEERYELTVSMACVSACRRYPCVVVWLCVDMEGKGRDVGDCNDIAVCHHGAQCASPLRSKRRRGG